MVSPLPCADPLAFYYRTRVAPVYPAAAAHFGFEFLNCFDLEAPPEDHRFEVSAFHADPVHLGVAGHRAVSERLVPAILLLLQAAYAPDHVSNSLTIHAD